MASPFKYLDPYQRSDASIFFGRESDVDRLYRMTSHARLVLLYGSSGVGKTSLIQAGLAGRLDGADWYPRYIRRGSDINESLLQALVQALPLDKPLKIAEHILSLYHDKLRQIYLIFDQLEELLLLGEESEQQAFIDTLSELTTQRLPCTVVLIIREDYLAYLNRFEVRISSLFDNRLRLEPLRLAELRDVVNRVCAVQNIVFDDGSTVDRIVEILQLNRGENQLGYLQLLLDLLYRDAQDRQRDPGKPVVFTNAMIEAIGTTGDLLGQMLIRAEHELEMELTSAFGPPSRGQVRRVLELFVTDVGFRRSVPYRIESGRIRPLLPDGAIDLDPERLSFILSGLERHRLIRIADDQLELAHQALASAIDSQRTLEERRIRELRQRIQAGYREYRASDGAELINISLLDEIDREPLPLDVPPEWQEFIEASRQRRAEVERERTLEAQWLLEERKYLEKIRQRRSWLGYVIVALLVVVVLGLVADLYLRIKSK